MLRREVLISGFFVAVKTKRIFFEGLAISIYLLDFNIIYDF